MSYSIPIEDASVLHVANNEKQIILTILNMTFHTKTRNEVKMLI